MKIDFPTYSGLRCLMMPYIQGDADSVPQEYQAYKNIINSIFLKRGDIGYLTIDESKVLAGKPHRGSRAKTNRAIHTEAGKHPDQKYAWGGGWGREKPHRVLLDKDVKVLLANNLDNSCAICDAEHKDTSIDGDIGHISYLYPYDKAILMKAGEVHKIGIFTPHESLPVKQDYNRQFLRIISSGVHGREPYFTENPLLSI